MNWNVLLLSLSILACIPNKVFAADFRYELGFEAGYFENLNLEADPVSDEVSGLVYAGISVFEDDANFLMQLDSRISTINYHRDVGLDQNRANLEANLIWRIQPGRFEWVLRDTFTQTAINTIESDIPTNRQNINAFTTGPNYIIRLNPKNNLAFEARAEKYTYEVNASNNRGSIAARWVHSVNPAFEITLNNEALTVEFDDPVFNDFNRNDIYLSSNYRRGANEITAEYGYTILNTDNIEDVDEDRFLLSISSARTRTSSIRLTYSDFATDTGTRILDGSNDSIDDSLNDTAANDIFIDETLRFQIFNSLSQGNILFEVANTDRAYKRQTDLDVNLKAAIISGAWNLRRSNFFTYNFRYINRDYVNTREDNDYVYSLSYSYALLRNFRINFDVVSLERASTLENDSYQDLRFLMSFNYTSS